MKCPLPLPLNPPPPPPPLPLARPPHPPIPPTDNMTCGRHRGQGGIDDITSKGLSTAVALSTASYFIQLNKELCSMKTNECEIEYNGKVRQGLQILTRGDLLEWIHCKNEVLNSETSKFETFLVRRHKSGMKHFVVSLLGRCAVNLVLTEKDTTPRNTGNN